MATKATYETVRDAVEIIKNDCSLQGLYMDAKGNTCAIGALAKGAGVAQDIILKGGDDGIDTTYAEKTDPVRVMASAIQDRFGFTRAVQASIQEANDSVEGHTWVYKGGRLYTIKDKNAQAERRTAVIKALHKRFPKWVTLDDLREVMVVTWDD